MLVTRLVYEVMMSQRNILISPQQICSQYSGNKYCGDDSFFTFSWGKHSKTVAISKTNNLPVLHTKSGMDNGLYMYNALVTGTTLNKSSLAKQTVPRFSFNAKPSVSSDICINCSSKHCPDCSLTASVFTSEEMNLSQLNNMSELQREFLHIHICSGHVHFSKLTQYAKKGLLPAKFRSVPHPVCVTCILGKQHKLARSKKNTITTGTSIKSPGDMIHMDQCIVTTLGRPMTHSGKNSPEKITCFTIFVDAISHWIHIHFQSSTDAIQTLVGKHRLERYG